MQHIENGIAVKAVVAKLKSEGQGCALSQSRLGQFLCCLDSVEKLPHSAGHQMRCEGLVLSKRRLPGLFEGVPCWRCSKHFPRWKHDTKR